MLKRRGLVILSALFAVAGLTPAAPAYAKDLTSAAATATSACGNYAAKTAFVTYGSSHYGLTQVSYSSCTRNAWGYLLSYLPPVNSAGNYEGFGFIRRSDGHEPNYCTIPVGATSCNTDQIYDGGYTSFAYGYVYSGSTVGYGQTGSY